MANAAKSLIPAAIAVAIAACSQRPPATEAWIRSGDTIGYGSADSEFDLVLECRRATLVFTTYGEPGFSVSRPVRIDVDGVAFDGTEIAAVPDGFESTEIAVPLHHPAVTRLARPANRISFRYGDMPGGVIAAGALPAQFVRNCRASQP